MRENLCPFYILKVTLGLNQENYLNDNVEEHFNNKQNDRV